MQRRIPILLMPQDRARLEVLAAGRDVSLSEAVRRAIMAEYDRTQEEETRQRVEDPLVARLDAMSAKMTELEAVLAGTSFRLLALINVSKGRAEIEAELDRLVRQ
ncbi:MAG: ribbon-helix-helix protein, CopG family [Verrucomicrobiota bacterium]